jgi:abequosyltransferase
MNYPIISICIPSYNRPNEINRLLNSIDCNTLDIEVVICDDKSPKRDEIKSTVDSFKRFSAYSVKYFENSSNKGFDGNLRRLINYAKGEYILFMGDDDEFVPSELDKFIYFIKQNRDKPYILRSYIVKHFDGKVEYFRYLPKTQILPAGETSVAWLIKRSVTISGFTISKKKALKFKTRHLDGTLLYQVYLMAQICLKNKSIYYHRPFVQCTQGFRKDNSMFGISKSEKNRYTTGIISDDNSINFTKAYFEITSYLDNIHGTNLSKLVRFELSKYSYPFLSIQRKHGILNFWNYTKRLEKEVKLDCTIYFHLYKWSLIFFGEKFCDRVIMFIKRIVGYTPHL